MKISISQTDNTTTTPFAATIQFNDGPTHPITITDPFTTEQEAQLEWYYEKWLRFPFTGQVKAKHAAASTQKYGETLFQQLFTDEALVEYKMGLRYEGGLSKMSFEIRGTPAFHALHWEALKDPQSDRPFAVACPFLRQNNTPPNIHIRPQPSPVLNILLVTARPGGRRDVGYRTISRPLVAAVKNAKLRTRINMVRPGTYKAFTKHLEESRDKHGDGFYHIVHFDLHGSLLTYEQYQSIDPDPVPDRHAYRGYAQADIEAYEGVKAFLSFTGEEEGQTDLVSDETVAGLLASHQIPITILNACQSGKQVGETETSLGSRLMAAGVQNALAMGYSVTVSAAEQLMTSLYGHLLADKPLAQAVRRGRLELLNDKTRRAAYNQRIELEDWLLPVMYQNHEVQLPISDFASAEEKAAHFEQESRRFRAPALPYGFFGRDVDILEIERRLLGQHNVLLIQGMGGAGKTTLLRHLMEWEQTTQLVDRVFYFGYDEKAYSAAQIMDGVARELYGNAYIHDFAPFSEAVKLEMLTEKLRSERHLLLLDNLESITGAALSIQHTLDAGEQANLRRFIDRLAGGRTLVLLGSRGREAWLMGDGGHNVYELPGLDHEAATDLSKRILTRHGADHYLNNADERTPLTRLLDLLDGHPLALEIVLPNLSHQTPTSLLAAFTSGGDGVDSSRGEPLVRPLWKDKTASILRCVEYSHSNLSPDAQALLACLTPFTGVFNSNWLPQYTAQLAKQPALAALPFAEWGTVLTEGMNWGLLTEHELGGGYLRLQPILPYFLRQRLNDPAQAAFRTAVETAFCAHYDDIGGYLAQAITSKEPQERQTGQALINIEYENLTTALKWELKAAKEFFAPYDALYHYLDRIQDAQNRRELGELVWEMRHHYLNEKRTMLINSHFIQVLDRLANVYLAQQQYQLAKNTYENTLDLLDQIENVHDEWRGKAKASIYHQLGRVAEEQRQWETAVSHYNQALAIYIEFNDRYEQAGTYHQLGIVAQEQRLWETAVSHYNQALAIKIEFNDRYSQASTYHQLGMVAEEQRQWETAVSHYNQALAIKIEFNDRHGQAQVYYQLGSVAQQQRQWETAVSHCNQALAIKIEFNDRYSQAMTYHQLGRVAEDQAQWSSAIDYFLKAIEIYATYSASHNQTIVMKSLARVWQASQDEAIPSRLAALLAVSVAEARALLAQ